ncbi:hypothetical protein PRIPAC_81767 [Pristionchus pacificus]|uniref:Uncharacterized protein n=1 Tax=Pristionchus pacificus TaxID=54126 RepID=A0A2A6BYA4_PRIPA|nr:hypothetical protein PRIPAC_81767 [Pristionchus pacificus]|eukprot:PDM70797.1 hypothetical protein PRIPAC_45001 [Pristionchus pacificus]
MSAKIVLFQAYLSRLHLRLGTPIQQEYYPSLNTNFSEVVINLHRQITMPVERLTIRRIASISLPSSAHKRPSSPPFPHSHPEVTPLSRSALASTITNASFDMDSKAPSTLPYPRKGYCTKSTVPIDIVPSLPYPLRVSYQSALPYSSMILTPSTFRSLVSKKRRFRRDSSCPLAAFSEEIEQTTQRITSISLPSSAHKRPSSPPFPHSHPEVTPLSRSALASTITNVRFDMDSKVFFAPGSIEAVVLRKDTVIAPSSLLPHHARVPYPSIIPTPSTFRSLVSTKDPLRRHRPTLSAAASSEEIE